MWAMTEVRPRGKDSMLSTDKAQSTGWIQSIPDLDDMYTCKTYEELEKIVNDWLNGDDGSDDSEGTEYNTSSQGTASNSSTDKSADASYKSLDDAFADLETM